MSNLLVGSPSEAVFVSKFAKGNRPLFKNQIELANKIMQHPKYIDKNPLTVRSTISQIFTGERNLSKNLQEVFFWALENNFDEKRNDYKNFEQSLINSFKKCYEERITIKRSKIGDRDYLNLIEATRKAKEFLITTIEPAELHKSELADQLKNDLLEKTGIVPSVDLSIVPAKYTFYLPKTKGGHIAREFWEKLRSHAMEVDDRYTFDTINQKLEEINSGENWRIKTFLVEEKIALFPFVFLDYTTDKVSGFCVSYTLDTPSVAELSYKVVYTWLEEIYPELNSSSVPEYEFRKIR